MVSSLISVDKVTTMIDKLHEEVEENFTMKCPILTLNLCDRSSTTRILIAPPDIKFMILSSTAYIEPRITIPSNLVFEY